METLKQISKILDKRALELVEDKSLGFYSCLFLTEKASRDWRPVIDLSPLDEFIRQTSFRMETAALVLKLISEGIYGLISEGIYGLHRLDGCLYIRHIGT